MTEPRRDERLLSVEQTAREAQTRKGDPEEATRGEVMFDIEGVIVRYAGVPSVEDISFDVYRNNITAIIGPSGCGKSTLIRCLNRMNDLIPSATVEGRVEYHGEDLYGPAV